MSNVVNLDDYRNRGDDDDDGDDGDNGKNLITCVRCGSTWWDVDGVNIATDYSITGYAWPVRCRSCGTQAPF